jgi:hypothetical protein
MPWSVPGGSSWRHHARRTRPREPHDLARRTPARDSQPWRSRRQRWAGPRRRWDDPLQTGDAHESLDLAPRARTARDRRVQRQLRILLTSLGDQTRRPLTQLARYLARWLGTWVWTGTPSRSRSRSKRQRGSPGPTGRPERRRPARPGLSRLASPSASPTWVANPGDVLGMSLGNGDVCVLRHSSAAGTISVGPSPGHRRIGPDTASRPASGYPTAAPAWPPGPRLAVIERYEDDARRRR